MRPRRIVEMVATVAISIFASSDVAADLPASFPGDVPVADYKLVTGVTE